MDKKIGFLIVFFSVNLYSQPISKIFNVEEIARFSFTSVHLQFCQNLINKSKKESLSDFDFWKEFNSEKCLPKEKIINMKEICLLELVDSTDEVAFFFNIICNENKSKKNHKKFELIPIMTVAESDPNDLKETEYILDPEYKNFRTKYKIGKELLKYKKHTKFDAEILKFDQGGDQIFYTIINIKSR
ncbi:hypothetical protein [Leptospira kanakyensis]|uniref:hypothetical protein n=1 Tax=Leptospira kanakyensis TaxID=2484968 RepID=UPI00223CFD8A|nr:hypothetical protein [Leptospira kanakyensis]MCW7480580.1 hypothetical protein [Leptospira kanakyensis]